MSNEQIQETAPDELRDYLLKVATQDPVFEKERYSPNVHKVIVSAFNSLVTGTEEAKEQSRNLLRAYFNFPELYPPIEGEYPHKEIHGINLPPLVIDDFERFKKYFKKTDPSPFDYVPSRSFDRLGMFAYSTQDPEEIKAYMDYLVDAFETVPAFRIYSIFHHFRMNPLLQGDLAEECLQKLSTLELKEHPSLKEKYGEIGVYKFMSEILKDRVKGIGVGGY